MASAVRLAAAVIVALLFINRIGHAGEIRMRSGFVLTGNLEKLHSIEQLTGNVSPLDPFRIMLVNAGHRRYYVPARQLAEGGVNLNADLGGRLETFEFNQQATGRTLTVAAVGGILEATPFDEFGHRRVTLMAGAGKKLSVIQGIKKITPETVSLTGLTHIWDSGMATRMIPEETLDRLLRKQINPDEPQDRLAVARFYIQAGYYPRAFQELDAIAEQFPDRKGLTDSIAQELTQLFSRQVLAELKRRRSAGQHQLALASIPKLPVERLGATVRGDVQQFADEYTKARDGIAQAKFLLAEYQAQVKDTALIGRLQSLRSTINRDLNYDTLPRLTPFLQAEDDPTLSAEEKLALAYSGWCLGPAYAVTSLDQAARIVDAEEQVLEFLRETDSESRQRRLGELRRLEGLTVTTALRMIPQLPPWIETPEAEPGEAVRLVVQERTADQAEVAYWVTLPPEYSPLRSYPLLVALRAENQKPTAALSFWTGTAEYPGMAARRGYIVIAPEYLPPEAREHTYGSVAHQIVLDSINDARRRFSVDSERLFLAGHGIGGDAAFDIGLAHPDEFAGVIPICGRFQHACPFLRDNARLTAWYVVSGELDGEIFKQNTKDLDALAVDGFHHDLVLAEYLGRGRELYPDEQERIFEWMDAHTRVAFRKEFNVVMLRKNETSYYWLQQPNLPKNNILPVPAGTKTVISPMKTKVRITPGNTIYVMSPSPRVTLLMSPELIDLEKRIGITVNNRKLNPSKFVEPDLEVLLENFRRRGDRQRNYVGKFEF